MDERILLQNRAALADASPPASCDSVDAPSSLPMGGFDTQFAFVFLRAKMPCDSHPLRGREHEKEWGHRKRGGGFRMEVCGNCELMDKE